MNLVQKIGSYFYPAARQDGAEENQAGKRSYACHQFTRIAGGVGLAGVAILSWKLVAAGALGYSAYQSGRYLINRISQRNTRNPGAAAGAMGHEDEAIERVEQMISPIEQGHEAHGHRQETDQEIQRALHRQEEAVQEALRRNELALRRQEEVFGGRDEQAALRRQDAAAIPVHNAPAAPEPSMLSNLWEMGKNTILGSAEMHPFKKVYKLSALSFAIFTKMIGNLFCKPDTGDMHGQLPSSTQYFIGKCFGGLVAFLSLFFIVPTIYYIYRLVK